ncbi:hypothetical protein GCM10017690_33530 [Microbacterium terregens]
MPAPGGLGGNTAITDGFYLAWKLAMVVKGEAGPRMLDSHDAERRPVSEMIGEQQLRNTVERLAGYLDDGALADPLPPVVQAFGLPLRERRRGPRARRRRGAAGGTPPPRPAPARIAGALRGCCPRAHRRRPPPPCSAGPSCCSPGRAPVTRGRAAAAGAAGRLGITLPVHRARRCRVGEELRRDRAGAVLVRPDRFVAWRSKGPAADADAARKALESALRTVLDRPGPVL